MSRYYFSDHIYFYSSGTQLSFYEEQYEHRNGLGFELNLGYRYQFVENFSITATAYYVTGITQYGGGLGLSVYF